MLKEHCNTGTTEGDREKQMPPTSIESVLAGSNEAIMDQIRHISESSRTSSIGGFFCLFLQVSGIKGQWTVQCTVPCWQIAVFSNLLPLISKLSPASPSCHLSTPLTNKTNKISFQNFSVGVMSSQSHVKERVANQLTEDGRAVNLCLS